MWGDGGGAGSRCVKGGEGLFSSASPAPAHAWKAARFPMVGCGHLHLGRRWVSSPRHHEMGEDACLQRMRPHSARPHPVGCVPLAICIERHESQDRGCAKGPACPSHNPLLGLPSLPHQVFFQLRQGEPLESDQVARRGSQVQRWWESSH